MTFAVVLAPYVGLKPQECTYCASSAEWCVTGHSGSALCCFFHVAGAADEVSGRAESDDDDVS
jgi:hypothetical protein